MSAHRLCLCFGRGEAIAGAFNAFPTEGADMRTSLAQPEPDMMVDFIPCGEML